MAPSLAYWKQRLSHPSAPLAWPNAKPRPAVQTYRGATEMVALPAQTVDALQSLATRESATLFMALAAGFFVLMHRYTGQTDITLGTPTASRTPETNHMMGYFLNMMPVRVDLSGNPSFAEVLTRVRTGYLDALHHGSVPLLRLLREIRPAYDPSRNPLFQIMISLQPPATSPDPAWDLTQSTASSGGTKMDMYVNMEMRPDGLQAPIAYNPDLLDAADVHRMFQDWIALLEGAVASPSMPISELPVAPSTKEERGTPQRESLRARIGKWFK
jgi:non-ribosomal peptide synthetase component F